MTDRRDEMREGRSCFKRIAARGRIVDISTIVDIISTTVEKGTIVGKAFGCFVLLLGATVLSGAPVADAQERDPRIGTWIEQQGGGSTGLSTSYEDLGDGRVRIRLGGLVVEARCDGANYLFTGRNGQPAGPTYSCRITGPRAVEYTYTQAGREPWSTSTGVETVSEDGETLTHVGVRRDADGTFVEDLRIVFSRHSPSQ